MENCSDIKPEEILGEDSNDPEQNPTLDRHFEPETVEALVEIGEILRGIHNRLISQGYVITDDGITHGNNNPTTKGNIEEN